LKASDSNSKPRGLPSAEIVERLRREFDGIGELEEANLVRHRVESVEGEPYESDSITFSLRS